MSGPGWCAVVREQLALLRELDGAADDNRFQPAPALSETALSLFEAQNRVQLPAEYRDFLLHVGGGGVGPVYGILPPSAVTLEWDGEERAPQASLPFPLAEGWTPVDADGNRNPAPVPAGGHLYDGCLELAEIGCGYFYLIVVTGPARGQIWTDYTAGDGALALEAADFRVWLERWIADQVVGLTLMTAQAAAGDPRAPVRGIIQRAMPWLDRLAGVADRVMLLEARAHALLCLGDREGARSVIDDIARVEPGRRSLSPLRAAAWSDEVARAGGRGAGGELARHPVREVRLAVAGNPDASGEAIEVLSSDADDEIRRVAARSPVAGAPLLERIAGRCMGGERSAAALLELELAIRHPRAPAALVAKVVDWAEGWQDDRLAAIALRAAALATGLEPELGRRLAASPHPEVRHGVARNRATGADELVALAADPDRCVRAAVALRRELPAALLAGLAADPHPAVRGAAGRNPNTPGASLRALAVDLTYGVSYDLKRNPRLPPDVLAVLAVHPYASELEPDPADGPDDEIAGDGRSSAAPACDVIAAASVGHPSFPVALLADHYRAHMGPYTMSSRPWLSAEQIAHLAADSYGYTRLGISRRPEIPDHILAQLAADPLPMVRAGAAQHERLPAALLARLLDDPSTEVLEQAAASPAAPIEALLRLAAHPVNYVRRGVARNPNAPPELIERLAADDDMQPRWWAALHPRIAPATLVRLAADPEAKVRTAAEFRRLAAGLVARS